MKKTVYDVELQENRFNDGYPDDYDFGQHLHDSDYIDDGMGEIPDTPQNQYACPLCTHFNKSTCIYDASTGFCNYQNFAN